MKRDDLWRGIVVAGCAYEIVALTTRRIPTVSTIVLAASEHKWLRYVAWLFVGGWAHHYLVRPESSLLPTVEAPSGTG